MPYYRQKTWLPMAPAIRGLSLQESRYGFRGMGQDTSEMGDLAATLAGPCYDASGNPIPCGTASSGLSIVNPLAAPSTQQFPVTGQPSTSFSAWLQQNQNVILIAGAGLFGIALLSGGRRR